MVHHPELNIELAQTTSHPQVDSEEYFQELKYELIELDKILFPESEEDKISEYLYPASAS